MKNEMSCKQMFLTLLNLTIILLIFKGILWVILNGGITLLLISILIFLVLITC